MLIQPIIRRFWTNGFCPFLLRSKQHNATSEMERIHHWVSHNHFHHQPRFVGWSMWWLMACLWPWRLLTLALQATRKLGPTIAEQTGKRLRIQFLEQLRFGLSHGLPPLEYYRYGCYAPARQDDIPNLIGQHEVAPLSLRLHTARFPPDPAHHQAQAAIIADKAHFAAFCAEQNLATPPLLALVDGEQMRPHGEEIPADGPGRAFFVKPLQGARGEATQLWHHVGPNQYAQPQGEPLAWKQLLAQLRQQAGQQPLLIQPLLLNHPALTDLAPGNLITIRLVTGRTPEGEIVPLAATLKVALQPKQIINTHGLNSPVDLESGTLGRAYTYHPLCPGYDTHPVTQAMIDGRTLPDWDRAVALARAAHRPLFHYAFLGWDITLTPDGPLLLEGNAGWETLMVQKPQQAPLGQTRFRDICLKWLGQQS